MLPLLMLVVSVMRRGGPQTHQSQEGVAESTGGRQLLLMLEDFSKHELDKLEYHDPEYIMDSFLSLICVMVAGLAAGLTMGMLSADELELEIFLNGGGTPEQQASAEVLMPIVKTGHQLLVTLLIVNSIANETLPIFMNRLMDWKMAIVTSATAVLFVGEIIPSAIFSGPHKLAFSAYLVPLVRVAMVMLFPVAWPLAKLLDVVLGSPEGPSSRFNRLQLQTIIRLHQVREFKSENIAAEDMPIKSLLSNQPREFYQDTDDGLRVTEVNMIQNALTIGARTVGQAMTPLEHMKTIASDTRLDAPSIASIVKLAHSRIPVYEGAPHNVRSVLMMRKLILTDTAVAPMVALLPQRQPLVVAPSTNLIDMLNEFQLGRSHFALVVVDPEKVKRLWARGTPLDEGDVVGLITCDDVMEELIGELADDDDLERENRKVRGQNTPRSEKGRFKDYMVTPSILSSMAPPLLQPAEPIESATFTTTATTKKELKAEAAMRENVVQMLEEATDDPSAALQANLKNPVIKKAMENAQITSLERAVEKASDAAEARDADRASIKSTTSEGGTKVKRVSRHTSTRDVQ